MLKIWGRKTSSNVQKVLWTCVELDVAFERVDWGGPFGGNQDPAYLAQPYLTSTPFKKQADASGWNPTPCAVK